MDDIDPYQYALNPTLHQRIFDEEILPTLDQAEPVESPRCVFIAAQQGSGKTTLSRIVEEYFAPRGGSVTVDPDRMKPLHPRFKQLVNEDDRTASIYTAPDARKWAFQARDLLIKQRKNIVLETTMAEPAVFLEPAALIRSQGYHVEVVTLAVPECLSRLGILSRYVEQRQAHGYGRMIAAANHDRAYTAIPDTLRHIEANPLLDMVTVVRRRGAIEYTNTLLDTTNEWAFPPASSQVLNRIRQQPLTYEEAAPAWARLRELRTLLPGPEWANQLNETHQLLDAHTPPEIRALEIASLSNPRMRDPYKPALANELLNTAPSQHLVEPPHKTAGINLSST